MLTPSWTLRAWPETPRILGQSVRVRPLVVEGRHDHHLAADQGAVLHVPGHAGGVANDLLLFEGYHALHLRGGPALVTMAFAGKPLSTRVR